MFALSGRRRLLAGLVATTMWCGCSRPAQRPSQPAAAPVPAATVATGTVVPSSTLGGIVVPFQNVQIQSSLTEPADTVEVNEGDHVRAGQVLARLDTRDLEATLRSDLGTASSNAAKAEQAYDQADLTIVQNNNSIASARSAVRSAQSTLATARLNLQRDAQLLANGYISQQTYDAQNVLVRTDASQLRSAQVALQNQLKLVASNGTTTSGLQGATVAAARADEQTALGEADNVRAAIAKATIVSPVDGIVVNRNLNPGEYPGSRQIFTVQQMDRVYAILNGSGAQVVGVGNGAATDVVSSDHPDLRATGKVVGVLDQVTPGSTNFIIKVLVPNPKLAFHSGMVVSARVTRAAVSGPRIPVTAFLDTTNSTVQVIDAGKAKTVKVMMLGNDGTTAVVRGLRDGQQVIANGQLGISDGQRVEPQKNAVAER